MPCDSPEPGHRMSPPATKCPSHQSSTLNQPLIWFLSLQVRFACLKTPHPQNCVVCTSVPGFICYAVAFEVALAYIMRAVHLLFFWVIFHCMSILHFDFLLWIGRHFVSTLCLMSRRKRAIDIPVESFLLTYILLISFSKTEEESLDSVHSNFKEIIIVWLIFFFLCFIFSPGRSGSVGDPLPCPALEATYLHSSSGMDSTVSNTFSLHFHFFFLSLKNKYILPSSPF